MPNATSRRIVTAALVAAASVALSGCWLTDGTYQEEKSAPSASTEPTPSRSSGESPTPVPNTVLLPPPVAPKVEVPWKEYSDKRTKIRFKLPHRPIRSKDDYATSWGGHVISAEYATRFAVDEDHEPVIIVISPYTVSGGVYTSGQTFFQSLADGLRDNGAREVSLSGVHTGTVRSHQTVFGTIRFLTHDKRKHGLRQLALITGPSWRLFVEVFVSDRTITKQEKRDVNLVLDRVLDGLRLSPPKA